MRRVLILAAATTLIAVPAAASAQRPSERIRDYAPAIDRTAEAMLNLDLGPILDAADPGRYHGRHTLRAMAPRDDPNFERRLHATVYGTAARMGAAADAIAAAEPALRRTFYQLQQDIGLAIDAASAAPYDDGYDRGPRDDDDQPAPGPSGN